MFIEDPERMKSWNPKIRRISSVNWGERAVGYRFRITYAMRKKSNEFLAEIIEYRRPERLVIPLTGGNLPSGSYANEIYQLF